ncbi:hypothetical protein BDW42DRAFT_158746 [Aspergillus taichungensis]|uniref:Transmembrane protein n=1 Tax=Aspergillus taichungensis TaxID=482145 RepID=A0A2J5I926_9EURO|nr:hypothetical protein BDW42DRAFT_158746 [Aspergillus taichungensis]
MDRELFTSSLIFVLPFGGVTGCAIVWGLVWFGLIGSGFGFLQKYLLGAGAGRCPFSEHRLLPCCDSDCETSESFVNCNDYGWV